MGLRHDGGAPMGFVQERELAEEVTRTELNLAPPDIGLHFARHHEIHRPGRRALDRDDGAARHGLRPQEVHDFAEDAAVEILEQRHARQHSERHHEIAAVDSFDEARRYDADRQARKSQAPPPS